MIRTLLVANRGEIACRVMRTARRMGIRTVAVYSDADASAPHVAMADAALHIGPSPAAQSYLNIEALVGAARHSGADAVHPGYGFLSERADFAQACADAGLVFVGPPPEAIRAMGDKAGAKRRMLAAGVPCAPGYLGAENDTDEALLRHAHELGTPLLVKAVAGGGGRGMRRVDDLADFNTALAGARREAESAFGDGRVMLEKLIEGGRHIEIQVFADHHGHALHLGERDCTAQRRRQKVIEEAPSPIVSPALRATMGADAVAAALAVGYRGAGTVEFIVGADGQHFFLEMNTRLQVEHPVTECITGLDLVDWQLRVAAGEPLPLTQAQVSFSGHAIEVRLYAEDPYDGWKPQAGPIAGWRPGRALAIEGVRVDHGIAEGGEVPPYYDAMVAKLIVHGRDRDDARQRLARALEAAPLLGLRHNGRFLRDLLQHPRFAQATMTTTLLDEWAGAGSEPLLQRPAVPADAWRMAAAVFGTGPVDAASQSPAFRPASVAQFDLTLECDGMRQTLRASPAGVSVLALADGELHCSVDGVQHRLPAAMSGQGAGTTLHLSIAAAVFSFSEPQAWADKRLQADNRLARAPVAGVVAQVAVAVGDAVLAGQPLLCVEAMKMEMWLHAAAAGRVKAVHAALRGTVAAGAVLIELEIDP